MRALAVLVVLWSSAGALMAQRPAVSRDVRGWMARVGERIEQYYARAQSIICEETVRLEPLGSDLLSNGEHIRVLVYELRISWEGRADGEKDSRAAPAATVLRQLLTVNGKPPRPGDEPGCLDPKSVSPEPLGMLLPHRQGEYVFTWKSLGRESGRPSVALDYTVARKQAATAVWKGDCGTIDLPTRGRVWLDPATADVLRLDEQAAGQHEVPAPESPRRRGVRASSFIVERADSSIAYRPVTFHDPDETLMLPASITSLQVIRNSGTPRLRKYQKFAKYRRFITGARIVVNPPARE